MIVSTSTFKFWSCLIMTFVCTCCASTQPSFEDQSFRDSQGSVFHSKFPSKNEIEPDNLIDPDMKEIGLKVSTGINGYNLVTTKDRLKGEMILKLTGEIFSQPNKYTIQLSKNRHILSAHVMRTNHHCHPNTVIQQDEMIALKDIKAGQEITFDYNTTEDIIAHPFQCSCCGKMIKGKLAKI